MSDQADATSSPPNGTTGAGGGSGVTSRSGVTRAHAIAGPAIALGIRHHDERGVDVTLEAVLSRADVVAFADYFTVWLVEHPEGA